MFADLLIGKRPAGTIGYDPTTNVIDFKPFKKNQKRRRHAKLLGKLPWGWVKESKMRVKVHESLPKSMGLERMLSELAVEHNVVCEALVDEAIVNRV